MLNFVVFLVLCVGVSSYSYHDPHCGGRQVIVHLFNWKWTDVALECERFLGPKGFCGVQISPPNEHIVEVPKRPWSERYAPVSYKLTSRSGTEAELRDMVIRCKKVGVRIYADVVINHMAGVGFTGIGSAGSYFDAAARRFDGVPYTILDFNMIGRCPNADNNIHNYQDVSDVRNCNLGGLTDLNQEKSWVGDKIADYLNSLIDIGIAGFRVDASKHMWPGDLAVIWSKLYAVDGGTPFSFHEVHLSLNGAVKRQEYFDLGYVTEFTYGDQVREAINNFNNLRDVVPVGMDMAPTEHAFVFVDNHDNQRGGQLSYKNPAEYKRAQAFTLAFNYGFARVMSSYYFTERSEPPPHEGDTIKDVIINSDGSCGNGWVCEHRWKPIANMARFRNDVINTGLLNWNVDIDFISFSRGHVGFFAMGKQTFNKQVYTGLPVGDYCDLISDCAKRITVDDNGMATVSPHDPNNPFVAFTTKSKDGLSIKPSLKTSLWSPPTEPDFQRTIVLVKKETVSGEDVFIRGGIDHSRRPGCDIDPKTSPCSIPIRHRKSGDTPHFDKVNTWSSGDNYLDWYGAELDQGEYQNERAHGTPTFWSTNMIGQVGYSPLNWYGPHFWIMDVEMDCSRNEGGYFEFKALVNGKWENSLPSSGPCSGSGAGSPPFNSSNHIGRCGYVNVFHFNSDGCEIKTLS